MAHRTGNRPGPSASFKEYMAYYLKRKNWSQSKLAVCARLNQSHVNKIINERIYRAEVDTLLCICLALQLTVKEAVDLMARAERAVSPASPCYKAYLELLHRYSQKDPQLEADSNFLLEADEYLRERKLPALPDTNRY